MLRGKLKEEMGMKEALNDYDRAVECDSTLQAAFHQRALFYRKSNRREEFERDLASFKALAASTSQGIKELADAD